MAKLAKVGNTLEINYSAVNCGVSLRASLIFVFIPAAELRGILTKNKLTIKAQFKYGTGDYDYICEGTGLVGFLHIAP